jgi:hypothetical protein
VPVQACKSMILSHIQLFFASPQADNVGVGVALDRSTGPFGNNSCWFYKSGMDISSHYICVNAAIEKQRSNPLYDQLNRRPAGKDDAYDPPVIATGHRCDWTGMSIS